MNIIRKLTIATSVVIAICGAGVGTVLHLNKSNSEKKGYLKNPIIESENFEKNPEEIPYETTTTTNKAELVENTTKKTYENIDVTTLLQTAESITTNIELPYQTTKSQEGFMIINTEMNSVPTTTTVAQQEIEIPQITTIQQQNTMVQDDEASTIQDMIEVFEIFDDFNAEELMKKAYSEEVNKELDTIAKMGSKYNESNDLFLRLAIAKALTAAKDSGNIKINPQQLVIPEGQETNNNRIEISTDNLNILVTAPKQNDGTYTIEYSKNDNKCRYTASAAVLPNGTLATPALRVAKVKTKDNSDRPYILITDTAIIVSDDNGIDYGNVTKQNANFDETREVILKKLELEKEYYTTGMYDIRTYITEDLVYSINEVAYGHSYTY